MCVLLLFPVNGLLGTSNRNDQYIFRMCHIRITNLCTHKYTLATRCLSLSLLHLFSFLFLFTDILPPSSSSSSAGSSATTGQQGQSNTIPHGQPSSSSSSSLPFVPITLSSGGGGDSSTQPGEMFCFSLSMVRSKTGKAHNRTLRTPYFTEGMKLDVQISFRYVHTFKDDFILIALEKLTKKKVVALASIYIQDIVITYTQTSPSVSQLFFFFFLTLFHSRYKHQWTKTCS